MNTPTHIQSIICTINGQKLRSLVKRPVFWILFFFIIRLTGITNPPLEAGHNWRQSTGLMVARNFLEKDANILYPTVDHTQGKAGVTGMEFPLLNYLHSCLARIFGYTHWYSRLINLIISSLGVFYFSRMLSLFFDKRIVLASACCLIGSVWFGYSRKSMPDTFCISLMLIAVYYGLVYMLHGKAWRLLLYLFFSSIAVLSKIPAGIYFALLFSLFLFQGHSGRKKGIACFSLIPFSLAYFWYFVWNPHLSATYGNWYNSGSAFASGYREIISHFPLVLNNFVSNAFFSYVYFILFLFGLFLVFIRKNKEMVIIFLLSGMAFSVFIFKAGYLFYHHSYYIIPFVPVMAMLSGYALSAVKKQWIFYGVLSLGMLESILNQQHDFFIKPSEQYKMQLETIADYVSSPEDLIVINGNGNPQQLYLAHRRGWVCADEQICDASYLSRIAEKRCKYAFVNTRFARCKLNAAIVFSNADFTVYKLPLFTHKNRNRMIIQDAKENEHKEGSEPLPLAR